MTLKFKVNKIFTAVFVCFFVTTILTGDGFAQDAFENTKQIKWLTFTSTGYSYERNLVRKDAEDDIKEAEKTGRKVKIFIALEDLNDDGNMEIFAWFGGFPYFCGSKGNCALVIYTISKGKLRNIGPWVSIYIPMGDKGQEIIGILKSQTIGWKDIFINKDKLAPYLIWRTDGKTNNIWKWNGSKYE